MRTGRKAGALLLAGTLSLSLAACGTVSGAAGSRDGGNDGGKTLTVFAAASLKTPFTALAEQFEAGNPGTNVTLSFAGSSDLATQISQGAPADVFASADQNTMARLGSADQVEGSPQDFASNVLTIAVPLANPASIGSFADLAKPGVKVVRCASQVPCGAAAKTVEKATGVTLTPVSEESSVADVLGKVASGEADAGLVYVTDVLAARGKVKEIPFAESGKAVNTYPIAAVRTSRNKDLAAAFIAMVTGPEGRQLLRAAGFGSP
ncbi:MAG: molybdate ABC transporter substrate-binding protein [Arthrobacter sp.]